LGRTSFQSVESDYQGWGIGTALCEASIQWAREQGYAWVLAMGAPAGLCAHAQFAGRLPWTIYAKLRFQQLKLGRQDQLPARAKRAAPPDVVAEAQAVLETGRLLASLHERLITLDLRPWCTVCGPTEGRRDFGRLWRPQN
jgi:hypothetical protein